MNIIKPSVDPLYSTFSPSRPTENVHSQRNRMVFLQPEPGFWMHMCVELGILRRQIKDANGKEKLATEYRDTELNDQALSAVLKIGYEQFKVRKKTGQTGVYMYYALCTNDCLYSY